MPDLDGTRVVAGLRVHEDDEARAAHVVGELGRELPDGEDRGPAEARIPGHPRRGEEAHRVVAAHLVAVAHDEDAGRGRGVPRNGSGHVARARSAPEVRHRAISSSTAPSGARSWIRSAICPSACVEHERHGS